MFGDLGQGLVISLFGFILTKWKKAKLGPIMERIGISSAIFGCLYGSVFGNEDIIKPFFHIEPLYSVLGKPNSIFQISTYLLIAALAIGVILIVVSMTMNIVLSFRRKDYSSALFGANGITAAFRKACSLSLSSSISYLNSVLWNIVESGLKRTCVPVLSVVPITFICSL